ncbi:RHS repeat-associated core domain-containing protein [Marinimicrobium locisalis]|uniref:RHS repeat-associated core domain-containing protein n=1 Tax=Marinimicrobium locisalis TaxID=546022 RepID=UPI003221D9A9
MSLHKPGEIGSSSAVDKIGLYSGDPLSTIPDPKGETPSDSIYYGALEGQYSVSPSGTLMFSLPLEVPVGINGMQPSLSLDYSSDHKNGILGWGWSLSGLPHIERCAKNWRIDWRVTGVSNHDSYGYCLDGQRLIEVSAGTYKTHKDDFSTIVKKSDYWERTDSDGVVYRFGHNSDSKTRSVNIRTSRWAIDKVEDIYGNGYTVRYDNEGYLQNIEYMKREGISYYHRLSFSYQPRPDVIGEYEAGELRLTKKRVEAINVWASGRDFWTYNIKYEEYGKNHAGDIYENPVETSRIYEIEQCFSLSDDKCKSAISLDWNRNSDSDFEYQLADQEIIDRYAEAYPNIEVDRPIANDNKGNRVITFDTQQYTLNVNDHDDGEKLYIDVDGDGYKDLVSIPSTKDSFSVYLNTAKSNEEPDFAGKEHEGYSILKKVTESTVKNRLMFYGERDHIEVRGWGASGESQHVTREKRAFSYTFQFADVTGNGLVDLIRFPPGCTEFMEKCRWYSSFSADISVAPNYGEKFGAFQKWADLSTSEMAPQFSYFLEDLNGDGLPDVRAIGTLPDTYVFYSMNLGINNGSAWSSKGLVNGKFNWVNGGGNWNKIQGYPGDFNGDGIMDYAQIPTKMHHQGAGDIDEELKVTLGTGAHNIDVNNGVKRFASSKVVYSGAFISQCGNGAEEDDTCVWTVVDYNDDGMDDLVEIGFTKDLYCSANPNWGYCEEARWTVNEFTARLYLSKGINSNGVIAFSEPMEVLEDGLLSEANIRRMKESELDRVAAFFSYHRNGGISLNKKLTNNVARHHIRKIYQAGRSALVRYSAVDDKSVYRQGVRGDDTGRRNGGVYAQNENLARKLVVKEINDSSYLTGKIVKTYEYEGYRYDSAGYGGLGFDKITVKETAYGFDESLVTVLNYHNVVEGQQYNLSGKLREKKRYIADISGESKRLLSHDKYQWKVGTFNMNSYNLTPSYYYPYIYRQSSESWDLEGTRIATSIKHNHTPKGRSCEALSVEEASNVIRFSGSYEDHEKGVLLYQEEVLCGFDHSDNRVVIQATKKSDVTTKGLRSGLVQRMESLTWTGKEITDFQESSFIRRPKQYKFEADGDLESMERYPEASEQDRVNYKESYTYDQYGYISSTLKSWKASEDDGLGFNNVRTTMLTSYGTRGERRVEISSPLVGTSSMEYHSAFDAVVKRVDVNKVTELMTYDVAGRIIAFDSASGADEFYQYYNCDKCFGLHSSSGWFSYKKTVGSSPEKVYYRLDNLRFKESTIGLNGDLYSSTTGYNSLGKVVETKDRNGQRTLYDYDRLGRLERTRYPDGTDETITYLAGKVIKKNRLSQETVEYHNAPGWLVQSDDANGSSVVMTYDSVGQLTSSLIHENGMVNEDTRLSVEYDMGGRRKMLSDPNMGVMRFQHNALGLLASSKDANGYNTSYEYDQLGRQITRVDDSEGSPKTHRWTYDTASNGKGKLHKVSGINTDGSSYLETRSYDASGRLSSTVTKVGATSLAIKNSFDEYGRPLLIEYPTGYKVANIYNQYGYLAQKVAVNDMQIIWHADEANAYGSVLRSRFGDGTETTREYDDFSNLPTAIKSIRSGMLLQYQEFDYDALNNLEERRDLRNEVTQSFCYDDLNRLVSARFDACSVSDYDYSYDALGNVMKKPGVEGYQYGVNAGPHAVSAANGLVYEYDASGNMTKAKRGASVVKEVEYSSFNKPVRMSGERGWSEVVYGPDKRRVKRTDSSGRSTLYAGAMYEQTEVAGTTTRTHRVNSSISYIEEVGLKNASYHEYRHLDHQGSVVAVTTDKEPSLEVTSYSPWGERLFGFWNGPYDPDFDPVNSRGYTGQEHLDKVGLIHMNGRVYDPELGRFLSPDPLIQAPNNTQSYNRYSYVFNNPLSFVDPTGYESEKLPEVEARKPLIRDDDRPNCGYGNVSNSCTGIRGAEGIEETLKELRERAKLQAIIGHKGYSNTVKEHNELAQKGMAQDQINNMSPADLLKYFGGTVIQNGDGQSLYFGPDSRMSQLFSQGDGAKYFESKLYEKYGGTLTTGGKMDNFGYKFGPSRVFGTSNFAEHVVGSWGGGQARVVDQQILFRATNTMGASSFFAGRYTEKWFGWSIGQKASDVHMTLEWTSPVR